MGIGDDTGLRSTRSGTGVHRLLEMGPGKGVEGAARCCPGVKEHQGPGACSQCPLAASGAPSAVLGSAACCQVGGLLGCQPGHWGRGSLRLV